MKSHISGIQIPTDSRINIDGGLTLDSLAGTSGHMMISQGAGNTPIWSNTLTSPIILTSLTTSSPSFDLLNTAATTINFAGATTTLSIGNTTTAAQTVNMFTSATSGGTYNFATAAATTEKILNIGTGAVSPASTIINIGSNNVSSSNIFLQGEVSVGKSRVSAGASGGYSASISGPSTTVTGSTGNATGGNLSIRSGGAGISDVNNTSGIATSGNISIDSATSSHAWFDGTTLPGTISIGTAVAASTTIGRSGAPTIINGTITIDNPLLRSISTVGGGGSEGGHINFARVTDGTQYWAIDSFGATSTPSLRFIENVTTQVQIDTGGIVNLSGALKLRSNGTAANSAPLYFGTTSPALLTTPVAGAVEFDGQVASITPNTSIGRTPIATSLFTSGLGTAPGINPSINYPIFPSANDTITLPIGTYKVEFFIQSTVATSTASATMNFTIRGGGTAVGTISVVAQSFAGSGTSGADNIFSVASATVGTASAITAANATAGRNYIAHGNGIMKITTAGTIIPSIQWSGTLTSGTVTLNAGNYLIITPLSNSGTTVSTGAWA